LGFTAILKFVFLVEEALTLLGVFITPFASAVSSVTVELSSSVSYPQISQIYNCIVP